MASSSSSSLTPSDLIRQLMPLSNDQNGTTIANMPSPNGLNIFSPQKPFLMPPPLLMNPLQSLAHLHFIDFLAKAQLLAQCQTAVAASTATQKDLLPGTNKLLFPTSSSSISSSSSASSSADGSSSPAANCADPQNVTLLAHPSQNLSRRRRRPVANMDNTLDGLVAKRAEQMPTPMKRRYQSETEAIELPDDEQETKRMETDPDVCTRMCSVCGYQGKWVSEMIRHKRVHTAERPFKCKYCNRTSKWKADLIRHVAKTHGIRVVSKYSRSKALELDKQQQKQLLMVVEQDGGEATETATDFFAFSSTSSSPTATTTKDENNNGNHGEMLPPNLQRQRHLSSMARNKQLIQRQQQMHVSKTDVAEQQQLALNSSSHENCIEIAATDHLSLTKATEIADQLSLGRVTEIADQLSLGRATKIADHLSLTKAIGVADQLSLNSRATSAAKVAADQLTSSLGSTIAAEMPKQAQQQQQQLDASLALLHQLLNILPPMAPPQATQHQHCDGTSLSSSTFYGGQKMA